MNKNFDTLEDEVLDSVLDSIMEKLKKYAVDEGKPCVVVPNVYKIDDLQDVYSILKNIFNDGHSKVYVWYGNEMASYGAVSVLTTEALIPKDNINLFLKAIETSDSFEIVPRTDGKVIVEFGFNHLTFRNKIKEEDA